MDNRHNISISVLTKFIVFVVLLSVSILFFCVFFTAAMNERNKVNEESELPKAKIGEKITEFQRYLTANRIQSVWGLLSDECRHRIPLEEFSELYWVKNPEGRAYISQLRIKSIQPADDRSFVVSFNRGRLAMCLSVDEQGCFWVEDVAITKINKSEAILPEQIVQQEKLISEKLALVLENFRKYQEALYRRDLRQQMTFFHKPGSERNFSTSRVNAAIAKRENLYKQISHSENIELRTDRNASAVTAEIKNLPLVWLWTRNSNGRWKISTIFDINSLDLDLSELPEFYFSISGKKSELSEK